MSRPGNPRRVDWRFLLPVATPRSIVSFAGGRLGEKEPAVGAAVSAPPGDECDVAVAVDPSDVTARRAFDSLREGGALYCEFRSFAGGPRRITRRLRAAGFDDVRVYWAWPPGTPSAWIPVGPGEGWRWALRRRRRLTTAVWRALRTAGLLRPLAVTARRPPLDETLGPGGTRLSGPATWFMLAPGTHALNKVVAFVSYRSSQAPPVILKFARTAGAAEGLERGAAVLRDLETAGGAPGAPRLVLEHRDGGIVAVGESLLDGLPLYRFLSSSGRRHTRQVTDWLAALAGLQPPPGFRESSVDIAREIEATAAAVPFRDVVARAGRRVGPADTCAHVFEQRDLSPWNVHIGRDGEVVVYDWESAVTRGFPALDLVYFLAYAALFTGGAMRSGRFRDVYRKTFAEGGEASLELGRYASLIGLDPAVLPSLRALTWLVHGRSALRPGSRPPSAFYLELLTEELSIGEAAQAGV